MMENTKDGKKMEKKITIKWAGLAPWTLAYKGRPSRTIYPKESVTLNLYDKQDLRHIIEVMKMINSAANEQSRVTITQHGKQIDELYYKWQITEGLESIPEKLRKLTYSVNSYYDEEINDVIKGLVPDFFEIPERTVEVKIRR